MMPCQHRPGQIIKSAMTRFTPILLPRRLGRVVTLLRHMRRSTMGAANPVGPARLADGFVTLDIVQQLLKVDQVGDLERGGLEPVQGSSCPLAGRAIFNSLESILSH